METINAQSIINEVTAAAEAIKHAAELAGFGYAPEKITPAEIKKDAEFSALGKRPKGCPWGFELEHYADTEIMDVKAYTSDRDTFSQLPEIEAKHRWELVRMAFEADAELLQDVPDLCGPEFVTIQTSTRGHAKIKNTAGNLLAFAAKVRSHAAAFGGGLVRTIKPRAAIVWPAKSVSLFKQLIEDRDYSAALDLAESKLGALFCINKNGRALLQVAPVPVETMPGMVSVMNEGGDFSIIEPVSMRCIPGTCKRTRNAQIEAGQRHYDTATPESKARILSEAEAMRVDQAACRAQWMAEHAIDDAQEIQARIDAQAAQDVAQVVASAQAMAAIEQASESSALQALASDTSEANNTSTEQAASQADDLPELAAVCEQAQQASQQAPGAPGGNMGHAGTVNTSSARQVASSARGQVINSKSGAWSALFFINDSGAPSMEFKQAGRVPCIVEFESGRDRMRTLQQSAKWADEAAARQADDAAARAGARVCTTPAASQAPDQSAPVLNSETSQDQSQALKDADPEKLTFKQLRSIGFALMSDVDADSLSMATIQRWAPALFAGAVEYLDDINYHSEALFLECMRAGRDDLAAVIAHLVRYQRAPEYMGLTGDYCEARRVVAMTLNGQAIERVSPEAAAVLAGWGFDSAPVLKSETPQDQAGPVLKSETPQDQSPAPGGLQITITRAEGNTETDTFEPVTVASFAAADAVLHAWSETAPSRGGYDKCDFSIIWPNGDTYSGRYDLKHHSKEPASLTRHMVDNGEFHTGKFCPLHMSQADYDSFLKNHVSEERRAVYALVLETMAGLGAYFEKVRPVAIDLRALTQNGFKAADLVGLGVVYTGDRCNPSAEGAIVAAELSDCKLGGVLLHITTEDGSKHRAGLSDFDGKGAHSYRLTMKRHGAPYLAQLAATVATIKAQASAAKEQAAQAHAAALVDLVAQYPQLQRAGTTYAGGKLAAVNMRTLLKLAFPGHKFSVTSDYNSARICWTDGPTDDEVNAIVGRFDIGASDTQSDYFYTVRTAWSDLFGGVQYLSTSRHTSDELVSRALCELYQNSAGRPTVQDYQNGAGVFDWHQGGDNVRRLMREQLAKMSAYQAPAPKARARA